MNETTKTETEKTDPTRKTNADADEKPYGMMNSKELSQHIKDLEDEHKAKLRTRKALLRSLLVDDAAK